MQVLVMCDLSQIVVEAHRERNTVGVFVVLFPREPSAERIAHAPCDIGEHVERVEKRGRTGYRSCASRVIDA